MTIEATFKSLLAHFGALRETLQNLRITVVEDRPLGDAVVIIDRMSDAIDDLNGWLQESSEAVGRASKAANYPIDGPCAIACISEASSRFGQLHHQWFLGLASYPQMADLAALARSRGREWRAWSDSVRQAMDQASHAMNEIQSMLLISWQELAERLSAGSVSVRTTNIGQQISTAVPEAAGDPLETLQHTRDRMT
jgi:hypothetical protein